MNKKPFSDWNSSATCLEAASRVELQAQQDISDVIRDIIAEETQRSLAEETPMTKKSLRQVQITGEQLDLLFSLAPYSRIQLGVIVVKKTLYDEGVIFTGGNVGAFGDSYGMWKCLKEAIDFLKEAE